MQTFLPHWSFDQSAKWLDNRRLNKQIVEVQQILNTLLDRSSGWKNHPAVLMWQHNKYALAQYGTVCYFEYIARFDKSHKSGEAIMEIGKNLLQKNTYGALIMPPWIGNEKFHASHRSNLLRKDPEWYGQFGWTEPDNLPYFWPTKEGY